MAGVGRGYAGLGEGPGPLDKQSLDGTNILLSRYFFVVVVSF